MNIYFFNNCIPVKIGLRSKCLHICVLIDMLRRVLNNVAKFVLYLFQFPRQTSSATEHVDNPILNHHIVAKLGFHRPEVQETSWVC